MTIRPVLNSFASGEVSPRLAGRVDLPAAQQGAQELTNFQVQVLGGVRKRPGTKFISEVRKNSYSGQPYKTRLIPFVVNNDMVFIIEITAGVSGDGAIRLFDVDQGDWCRTAWDQPPLEIAVDYVESELFEIKYTQTHREAYLVHKKHPPVWFRVESGTPTAIVMDYTTAMQGFAGNLIDWTAPTETWSAADLWENVAQWLIPNKEYAASGTFNGKTLSKVRRKELKLILTYASGNPDELNRANSYTLQGKIVIDLKPFYGAGNYPGAACFFAGRLWLGGSENDPATLWGSKPWDYNNFVLYETLAYKTEVKTDIGEVGTGFTAKSTADSAVLTAIAPALTSQQQTDIIGKKVTGVNVAYGSVVSSVQSATQIAMDRNSLAAGTGGVRFTAWKDALVPEYEDSSKETQQVGAGNAIRIRLATEEDETIEWIAAAQDLYVGTTSSEWIIPGSSSATQARAIIASRYGSSSIQARFVGQALMYVTPSSRHIRQLSSDIGQPLTMQAEHMVRDGIVQMDFQQSPDVALYCVLATGDLVRCLIEPSVGVMAWDRIRTRAGDKIESVCVVPGADRDYVYVVVNRTIGVSTFRFIEQLQECDDSIFSGQWYLDAGVYKSGSAFTTVAGLSHLNGATVAYRTIKDGVEATGTAIVNAGQVTVPSATAAFVGLPYSVRLKTARMDSAETEGMTKGVGRIFFRLFRSYGFIIKGEGGDIPIEKTAYTGPLHVTTDIPSQIDAALTIESNDPVPVGIQSIVPEAEIGG